MRNRNKMLTTTITRAAFAEKMKQVAEEGYFVEYKRINEYWSGRIAGVKLPTEMVFLVGASPYRFTAVSVEEVGLTTIPDYAREIVSDIHDGEFVYAITCKPIIVARGPAPAKQLQLTAFSSMLDIGIQSVRMSECDISRTRNRFFLIQVRPFTLEYNVFK